MEWQIIPAGRVWVDPGGPFGLVPEVLWKRHQTVNEKHLLPMNLNCLLIRSEGKTILVDNGLGDKLSDKAIRQWNLEFPEGTLIENLAKTGVQPEDVDIMLDTHLHSDHCGGNTTLREGVAVPTFPNAEYLVQRLEWADAMHPDARTRSTYLLENYAPVWKTGQFRFLHGDAQVTSEVRCAVTPGHTRGHQCVIVEGGERPLLYAADLATFAVHFERQGWLTAYDVEPLENIRTKEIWQRWALENEALILFEHDTTMRAGELIMDEDGRLKVMPVEIGAKLST
ncbi:MAG: MBL fold metallo-hydrolase [Chloroflexi bacterium]|nr:MBL fold metallo-hydrolase [Chloroflexota bacterium]MQC26997.1 MBL fold metallo-hydrolase [Chloroflexota bacterium]